MITQSDLRVLTEELIDVHGQYMHQALLDESTHIETIDRYGAAALEADFTAVREAARAHEAVMARMRKLEDSGDEAVLKALKFEARELSRVKIDLEKDQEMLLIYERLSHQEELMTHLEAALFLIDDDQGTLRTLHDLKRHLMGAESHDADFTPLMQRVDSAMIELSDIRDELRSKQSDYEFDPDTFREIEDRYNTLSLLMKKYGMDLEAVAAYEKDLLDKIEALEDRDRKLVELREREAVLYDAYHLAATALSAGRKAIFDDFKAQVMKETQSLNLTGIRFDADFRLKTDGDRPRVGPGGFDDIRFLLSANPGVAPLPLKTVASGGEISRIMLGIKIALSRVDPIDTMIFDEIDTGISGHTAHQVALKMGTLSRHKQLIVITHLPQIAAAANRHFKIEKLEGLSQLIPLDSQAARQEVARMLSGDRLTQVALDNARHLITQMQG
jgi:DNA repair protein RecN (Recombination protein N)